MRLHFLVGFDSMFGFKNEAQCLSIFLKILLKMIHLVLLLPKLLVCFPIIFQSLIHHIIKHSVVKCLLVEHLIRFVPLATTALWTAGYLLSTSILPLSPVNDSLIKRSLSRVDLLVDMSSLELGVIHWRVIVILLWVELDVLH